MFALFGYDAVSLCVAYGIPSRRLPVGILLAIDLVLVAAACFAGISSGPFLGLLCLISYARSLFYGFRGGIASGTVAAVLKLLLAIKSRIGSSQHARDPMSYVLLICA